MSEEMYFDLCIAEVRRLKKACKQNYPFIRWTNKIILGSIKVHQGYISPSKKKHIKDNTFKKIYIQMKKLTAKKIMDKIYKASR